MIRFMAAAALLACAGSAGAAQVSSTFDTGSEGWVSGSLQTGAAYPGNSVVWVGSLKLVRSADTVSGDYSGFLAPAKFLGDLSGYAGGSVSFQLADLAGNNQVEAPLALFGTAGTLYAYLPYAPGTSLSNLTGYSIGLVAANFYTGAPGSPQTGVAATDAQLRAVLANVTGIGIGLDFHAGTDDTYLDNVVLSSAVPEPATWATMALGLAVLGGAARGRRRRGGPVLA